MNEYFFSAVIYETGTDIVHWRFSGTVDTTSGFEAMKIATEILNDKCEEKGAPEVPFIHFTALNKL
ncbi:MAG: hypothetical protein [Edwardsiella phage MSW-3]|nr:MAG: hypothetical protein [Edwardsiella phage MSW-3]